VRVRAAAAVCTWQGANATIFAVATSLASGSFAVSTAREAPTSAAAAVDTSTFTPTAAFIAATSTAATIRCALSTAAGRTLTTTVRRTLAATIRRAIAATISCALTTATVLCDRQRKPRQ